MYETDAGAKDNSQALASLFRAVRDDLLLLALLHDRELSREALISLRQEGREDDFFGLELQSAEAQSALRLLRQGLDDIPRDVSDETLHILAAEYADIYLNFAFNASPYESVWTDEDGLTMQQSMFQVRAWYRRHGLVVENWRMRPDDHLVTQLQFLGHLLDVEPSPGRLTEIARFLDEHLLRWVGTFAERVAARCNTRLYAGLAQLTSAYLDELRDLAAGLLDSPRPTPDEVAERMRAKQVIEDVEVTAPAPWIPGSSPSW